MQIAAIALAALFGFLVGFNAGAGLGRERDAGCHRQFGAAPTGADSLEIVLSYGECRNWLLAATKEK